MIFQRVLDHSYVHQQPAIRNLDLYQRTYLLQLLKVQQISDKLLMKSVGVDVIEGGHLQYHSNIEIPRQVFVIFIVPGMKSFCCQPRPNTR